jgi:hypothetical protein
MGESTPLAGCQIADFWSPRRSILFCGRFLHVLSIRHRDIFRRSLTRPASNADEPLVQVMAGFFRTLGVATKDYNVAARLASVLISYAFIPPISIQFLAKDHLLLQYHGDIHRVCSLPSMPASFELTLYADIWYAIGPVIIFS